MKRIARWYKIVFVLVALLVIGRGIQLAQAAPVTDDDVDALIANAESAAPTAIAQDATILGWDEDGMATVVLREGTNGWTCVTDWSVSPGNDPQCLDPIWAAWSEAYAAGEEPEIPGLGIGYMLQGGSDPSNSDPMAMQPAKGEDWVTSPPHVMFLMPDGFDADIFSTTPSMDEPYIMWDGTPYEHLMLPVVAMAMDGMGDADAEMQSAMSAAPASIAENATIMGNPETAGDPMVVLQEGTNGWVCYPDRAVSPGNDPSCNDAIMDAGFANGTTRDVPDLGIGYMLQGGSDESNTDPTAMAPAEGEEWITTPAHVMAMVPGGFDAEYYTSDHASGYPYVMMAGTDFEHLMIPVADMPAMDMGDEAIEQELLTFDLMVAGDWEAFDAVTHPNYYQIGTDGGYIERDAALAGLMDEKLVVLPPDLSEIRVQMITPNAYVVTYRLNFNGSYDGFHFSNPRTVASTWVKEDGKWQNIFLVDQYRTAPLYDTDLMSPTVMIPNGFQPEGIAIGRDATAYVSSVGSGAIYKVNLATGEGSFFVEPQETQKALGMVYDQRTDLLYVAGHSSGNGLVYNGLTGELVANVQFTTDPDGLVNDVALADDVVYFTDSNLPLVYQLPLAADSHQPDPSATATISLTGEFEHLPGGINGNGIVATADGTTLIIAHTDLGKLYTVDAASGEATEFALDGEVEIYHDGLVLAGDTLYIVNYNDKIYKIELAPDWMSGTLVETFTDPMLEAPATAAIYDDALYVVNARWDAEQTPDTEFWLTQLKR